ncbi:MAG: glycosyltransferase [Chloroflexi bacterium]|nr:glycosyltransferase [Chloroflexota bacterium]
MIRVLHIYKNFYPVQGGIENHIRLLGTELARRDDFQVTVLVTNSGRTTSRENHQGVEVIKTGQELTLARTPLSLRLWYETSRQEADITHLHFPYPFGEVGHLLFGRGGKTVITYHSDVVNQKRLLALYRPLLWRVLRKADRVIATTPNYIRSSPFLTEVANKCTVVPFGIDLNRFQGADPAQAAAIRQRYGSPLLLFVGMLRYYKGLQHLLDAMPNIPAKLLLVGRGPMEHDLRALVRGRALQDKVVFLGEVSDEDLPSLYHACDVFVLPASHRSEAFGIVQLEAMACGKPVVCTELGTGTSWVNLHGQTGLVVPPANPRALSESINRLIEDGEWRTQLGRAARERVEREFTKERMVERMVEVYRGVLSA